MAEREELSVGTLTVDRIIGGGAIADFPTAGKKFYLDPLNGSDGNNGLAPDRAFKSLLAAYNACTTNKNDVIYWLGSGTGNAITTNFVWAKNFTHLVGVASKLHNGGRCRITHSFNNSANTDDVFEISGRGCQFVNIHWQFGRGSANNLRMLTLSYSGNACNSFVNCDFEGPLHATEAAAAFNLVRIEADCADNSFYGCRFGNWTVQADYSSGHLVKFIGNNAVTYFENCTFMMPNTSANSEFVDAGVDMNGGNASVIFQGCRFINLYAATLTRAIVPPTSGVAYLFDCRGKGFTDWCDAANTHLFVANGAASAENGGIAVATS